MAGILSRSTPSPVTGVVATTWNAGIWGAGAGADGGEGAGAETRVDGADRAGMWAGVGRRTRGGGGRGAVTVTSGSVSPTWAQATSSNIKAPGSVRVPTAAPCNKRRLPAVSRDGPRPRPSTPRMALTYAAKLPATCWYIPNPVSCDVLAIRDGTFGNVARRPQVPGSDRTCEGKWQLCSRKLPPLGSGAPLTPLVGASGSIAGR